MFVNQRVSPSGPKEICSWEQIWKGHSDEKCQLAPNTNGKRTPKKEVINSFLVCHTEDTKSRSIPTSFH